MQTQVSLGSRRLDCTRNVLIAASGEVQLSPLASRFLQALADHPGEVVTRQALIDRLWDGNALIGEPALNRVVSELRKATGDTPASPTLVQTIPRKGYRLVSVGAEATPALPRTGWPRWKMAVAVLVAIVVTGIVINWTLDTAIGLIWVANHPG
jgi:DNA-binding winged helix-turn-helix (wHTH) protein